MNLSGRNVVLLLGDDALVKMFATKSTPSHLYLITGPLSRESRRAKISRSDRRSVSAFLLFMIWIPTLESRGGFALGVVRQHAYD